MLEIVLCEDNKRLLENYISMTNKIISENDINAAIKLISSDASEIGNFLKSDHANLFILDIDLKSSITGFQLAQKIRAAFKKSYILFISAHLEYVFQSFTVRPFNFLPKPVGYEILETNILEIYKDHLENGDYEHQKILSIKLPGSLQKVKLCDIVAIERVETKTVLHLKNSRVACTCSMSEMMKMLNDSRFVRTHKSFICNKDYISEYRFSKSEILMENGMSCCIGRSYKKGLLDGD